jgi:Uma2 family endonuclease
MNLSLLERKFQAEIIYPESDGKPMAENTVQYYWLTTIKGNVDILVADQPDVFVAGDLLWYPVEGHPEICTAPDVLVVFGRPKGDRGSYQQWREANIPPQVVFEILSPGNTATEMRFKRKFFERYGVEEYYIYNPDVQDLEGWQRRAGQLVEIPTMDGWVSPRLGIRFEIDAEGLALYYPDGRRFLSFVELAERADEAELRARQAEEQLSQAEERAKQAEALAARLAAKLRELGVDPGVSNL